MKAAIRRLVLERNPIGTAREYIGRTMVNASRIFAATQVIPEIAVTRRASPADLAAAAVSALIDAAELTPNGDVRRSALSLETGFAAIGRAARGIPPSLALREEIGWIGREMERRSLDASGGGTAHRGAIWTLGLVIAGAACRTSRRNALSIAAVAGELARLPDKFAPRAVLTAGGTASPFAFRRLKLLHDQLMAVSASPSGSVTLLAATLFLDGVEGSRV